MQLARTLGWFRMQMASGTTQIAVTIMVSNVLRIASSLILTRALSPADFGITGITGAILIVMLMISDLGFGIFLIQHPRGDDRRLLDVVWTLRLIRAVILTLMLVALAAPLAWLLDKPEMRWVIAVTALSFIVEGGSALTPFTAVREQRLGRLALLDITAAVAQTAIGIVLALLMHNYWAIVLGGLAGTAVKSLLTFTMYPGSGRRVAFDRSVATELWRFGRVIASANTIHVLLSNCDKFVLSRLFPLNAFGLYTLAVNLAGAPSAFTSLYPSRVLLPAYAAALRRNVLTPAAIYYDARRWVMTAYLLGMGGFIGMAPAIIDLLYDQRYAHVHIYLRLLSLAPAIALNNYAAREMLIVMGRLQSLLYANFVRLAWLTITGTIGYVGFGTLGVVAAVGMIELPVMVYCWTALHREGVFRWADELTMLATLACGIALGFLCDQMYFVLLAAR